MYADRIQMIKDLYRRMPGAPKVPVDGWNEDWGVIIGNEHWEFCAAVVGLAIDAAQAYSR